MFLDKLSAENLEALLVVGARRSYQRGSILFLEGETSDEVFIIRSGQVKLTRTALDGSVALIEVRGSGDIVGEVGVLSSSPRGETATAITAVNVGLVSARKFKDVLVNRGAVAYALLQELATKIQQSSERRLEYASGDTLARLCRRLVELAADIPPDEDGVILIDTPLTQQELAEWIGASRDAVVLALGRLRELGWARTGRKRIEILELDAIRRVQSS